MRFVPITPGSGDHNGPYDQGITAPPAEGEALAPCPFCGCDYASDGESAGLEVCNTHTPFFWVRCNACGAEHHGNEQQPTERLIEGPDGHKRDAPEMYVEGRAMAVAAWNRRDTRWQVNS